MKTKKILTGLALALSITALVSCGTKKKNDTGNTKDDSSDVKPADPDTGVDTPGTGDGGTGSGSTGSGSGSGSGTGSGSTGSGSGSGSGTGSGSTGSGSGSGSGTGSGSTGSGSGSGSGTGSGSSESQPDLDNPSESGSGEILEEGAISIGDCLGTYEAGYVEWTKNSAVSYNVYIKKTTDSTYKLVDEKLGYQRSVSSTRQRVDIIGIQAGSYNVKIVPVYSSGEKDADASICSITTVAYDRSGYAHFNYNDGVGAYNDDGTLKDDAIVIYVTDDTKNTVTLSYGTKSVSGIGNILNSVGAKCGEPGHENECKKVSDGKAYYALGNENDGIIKYLAENNIPLVVRFVGTISETGLYAQGTYSAADAGLIDGLTEYNSNNYGGSLKDNGHMARMKSGKNITLEGVGDDAILDGWGVHFICETAAPELGKNFEVRNLAFMNTPEDAIGMEGQQEGTTITAGVERCWIHHNTFLAPSISSPTESDKSEGDGSCDFKRGQYFTASYNYYEYCHKTNLIGSSDSSLQYNISFHHNLWYNCGSRIPLTRQANVHFYNNYIFGDQTDTKSDLSYVSSLRARCYLYSEYNYYDGCKEVFDVSGGAVKGFGNTYVSCLSSSNVSSIEQNSRTASVSSSCAYNGVSYKDFDTNSSLFYYDSKSNKSNCYLTDAVNARIECILKSGSGYRTALNKTVCTPNDVNSNKYNVTESIDLSSGSYVANIDNDATGIVYNGVEKGKFKGQGITFRLNSYATVSLSISSGSSAALSAGAIIDSNGKVWLIGSGEAILEPGLYYICSCLKDKESSVSSLTFTKYDSEEYEREMLEIYNNKVSLIPTTIEYTDECYDIIKGAIDTYESLSNESKQTVDYTIVSNAYSTYESLGVAFVEAKINAIGTVNSSSGEAISTARAQYELLISRCKDANVSNYSVLTAAEASFEEFAVASCIDKINAIGTVTLSSGSLIEAARNEYDALSSVNKELITNYQLLVAAEKAYNNLVEANKVDQLILNCDDTLSSCEAVVGAYDALTEEQKSLVTKTLELGTIKAKYVYLMIEALPQTITRADKQNVLNIRLLYDALTEEQKSSVSNLSKLEAAEAVINSLPTELTTVTSDFSSGWTITGATSTTSFSGTAYTGNTIVAISNESYTDIETISVTISSADKGTTDFKVYYSVDGVTWISIASFKNANNNQNEQYTYNLETPVTGYIKVECTCSKGSAKAVSCSSISIKCYD